MADHTFQGEPVPEFAEAETPVDPFPGTPHDTELTDSQKIHYVYTQALAVAALVEQAAPLIPQIAPLLESAGPLLAGLTGQASSPMARILGSVLR